MDTCFFLCTYSYATEGMIPTSKDISFQHTLRSHYCVDWKNRWINVVVGRIMHPPSLGFDKSLLPMYIFVIFCVQLIVEGPNMCKTGSKAVFTVCQKTTILVRGGFPKRTEFGW